MALEIYPVVHVKETSQAVEQSQAAFEAGADGVYLIDHTHSSPYTLVNSFNEVTLRNPHDFIGLNFLQHTAASISLSFLHKLKQKDVIAKYPDGLWSDDANEGKHRFTELRARYPELTRISYLGGIAFKGTRNFTDDPETAVAEAVRLESVVDVVTTSGKGTGRAPNPEKIRAMKFAIGNKKLAVASGISIENLTDYTANIDQLLVSTSIETKPHSGEFDQPRLKELVVAAHEAS